MTEQGILLRLGTQALRGKVEIGSTFVTVLQRYAEILRDQNCKLMLVGLDQSVYDQRAKAGAQANWRG